MNTKPSLTDAQRRTLEWYWRLPIARHAADVPSLSHIMWAHDRGYVRAGMLTEAGRRALEET